MPGRARAVPGLWKPMAPAPRVFVHQGIEEPPRRESPSAAGPSRQVGQRGGEVVVMLLDLVPGLLLEQVDAVRPNDHRMRRDPTALPEAVKDRRAQALWRKRPEAVTRVAQVERALAPVELPSSRRMRLTVVVGDLRAQQRRELGEWHRLNLWSDLDRGGS